MSYDVQILRAMLRLSRKREVADAEALVARAGGTGSDVREALRRLDRLGLVERLEGGCARLTMAGLAVAVSTVELGPKAARPRVVKRANVRAA